MARKKLETRPIPAAQRVAFFAAMRELQDSGQACVGGKRFPNRVTELDGRALLSRQRHGFAMETMLRCGLRFSELARLQRDDLNEAGSISVTRSKRGRDGEIGVPVDFAIRLSNWHRRHVLLYQSYSPFLFPNRSGARLSISVFNRMLAEFAGLFDALRISSHVFRDTAAVIFINQRNEETGERADIVDAARFLGHNRVSSTEIYVSKKESQPLRLSLEL